MEAANVSKIMQAHGLSAAEIRTELALLRNALDYYNQTQRIDVAYDGFFFEKDLNTTRQIIEYTKPVSEQQNIAWLCASGCRTHMFLTLSSIIAGVQ